MEGDVIEPSGTLTGGAAKSNSESIIKLLQSLNKYEFDLNHKQQKLNDVRNELRQLRDAGAEYRYICMYAFILVYVCMLVYVSVCKCT